MTPTFLPLLEDDAEEAPSPPPAAARPGCGELRTASGERLPLKTLTVDVHILGLTATSSVVQRFVNDGTTAIEATYVFPLPARAGVTGFVSTLGGRRVVGILKERGEARDSYEEAMARGQRAAIVEEDRPEVFTVRVGNLGPGEEAVVELVLTGPLEVQGDEATFRFPLVVAPRYSTGSPIGGDQTGTGVGRDTDSVPDASRVTPPRLEPGDARPRLDVTVSVDTAGLPLSDPRTSVRSSIIDQAGGSAIIRVEPGGRADRDFLLRLRLDRSTLASSAVAVEDGGAQNEGTWSLTIVPPARVASEPRDVVVVLDRSGSMGGWKIVAARRAAARIVDMLDAGDRFCVVGFDDRIERPRDWSTLVEASDRNRFAAVSWLGSLEARGGTEMAQPLMEGAGLLAMSEEGRRATLVLVTDGQITGEDHVLRSLQPRLGATTVHCVGIDRAVNAGFLERLARHGRGRFQLVESEDRLDDVMAELTRSIGRPSLTRIDVRGHGIDIIEGSMTPNPSPDAFAGVPWVISGRYHRIVDGAASLEVSAAAADGPFTTQLDPVRSESAAVRTIWARGLVRDLEDAYASGRDSRAGSSKRIVEHSIRFGVLSRFTAFVAVDPEQTDAGVLEEVTQPVEQPSGWAVPAVTRALSMPAVDSMPLGKSPRITASRGRTFEPAAATQPLAEVLRTLQRLLADPGRSISELVMVCGELAKARDAASDRALRDALTRLHETLDAYIAALGTGNHPRRQPVERALKAVRSAMRSLPQPSGRSRRAFWK
jgi:Mg-chelatase subunit ChlD